MTAVHTRRLTASKCLLAVASLALSFTPAGAACDTDEIAILSAWKKTANQSAVGSRLLEILNSSSTVLAATPRHKQSRYIRGYLYGIIGCTGLAIADLSKAIDEDPAFAAAYTERGICYMDQKTYDKAKVDLDRAVALNPSSGDARMAHGKLMLELDKPAVASNDFRACQSSMVTFTPALPGELPANYYNAPDYYLGVCEEAMGRTDAALKHYKSATKSRRLGGSGYLKRYSDQPLDASARVSMLELGTTNPDKSYR